MGVDYSRHDGLAAEIHAGGASRNLYVRPSPGLRNAIALDDEHRVLDRRTSIPDNEAGPLEHGHSPVATGLRAGAASHQDGTQEEHGRHRD